MNWRNKYILLISIIFTQCGQEKKYVDSEIINRLITIRSEKVSQHQLTGAWKITSVYLQESTNPDRFTVETPFASKFTFRTDSNYIFENIAKEGDGRFYGAGIWSLDGGSIHLTQETPFPEKSSPRVILKSDSLIIDFLNKSPVKGKPGFVFILKRAVPSYSHKYFIDTEIIAFKEVNLVTMENDKILLNYTLITEGGIIKKLGPTGQITIPDSAYVIVGQGKYLMPGLADMHVHFNNEEYAKMFIVNGVTTVRNMWGGYHNLLWKKDVENHLMLSPRIYTTGPLIDGKDPFWPGSTVIESRKDGIKEVGRQKKLGYDFIKVYSKLNKEAYVGIMEGAKKFNIKAVGHLPYEISLKEGVQLGQYSFEHLDGSKENPYHRSSLNHLEYAAILKEAQAWSCPTMVVYQNTHSNQSARSVIPVKYIFKPDRKFWENKVQFDKENFTYSKPDAGQLLQVKALRDQGVGLLLGTDTPNPGVAPGFSILEELINFTDAGLSPFEAIATGTINAARFLGTEAQSGTITEGKRADLILLDKNPLSDVRNISGKVGVMVNGKWIPKDSLDQMLKDIVQ